MKNSEARKRRQSECGWCIDGKRPSPHGPVPCGWCDGTGYEPEDEK